ncbi:MULTISPECIES: putative glutamine/gamma-aminobutyrate antiporter GadC [Myxococcus]|uniref:putative glutamine/gamma-aminobutyrate antiporter GadC n=1 Tax=Myxococcus TaxID=32 RepID=UPI0011279E2F|nr:MULTISPECIES: putative glutamine/gamma-aminobutyrate antiporter GadC [Myxococcus]WAM24310.1 amino acid permease [Myxococcus sp. NMCA1]
MESGTTRKPIAASAAPKLGVLTLAIMNVTAVVSLRGMPAEAEYGLTSIFYYTFAAVFFLIPVSLVAAELATGWPEKGGVFRWVGEAFGPRWGFLAIFLVWIESTIWFPTVLTFGAVALAFVGPNQTWDKALSSNKFYTILIVLGLYWAATFVSLRGLKTSSKISKWAGLIGTIIPAALLIVFGLTYLASGRPIQIQLGWDKVIPDFSQFGNLVLAASIFLFYAGMEMNAIHVVDAKNPSRTYPLAILIASVTTVVIFVLGTLAISVIIPKTQINLTQSLLVSYRDFFNAFGMAWLSPAIAVALFLGVLGSVTVWVSGPSAALGVVGRAGYLPPFLQRRNRHGAPSHILIVQGMVVTFLALMFVILPSVQAAYQILSQLTSTLYLLMYMLMFSAAIYLRYSEPHTQRAYRVPGGEVGMWVIGGAGLIGALVAFVLSFIPPSQIKVGSPMTYVLILIAGNILFVAIPLILYARRKASWRTAAGARDMAPFNWEKPGASGHPGAAPTQGDEEAWPPMTPHDRRQPDGRTDDTRHHPRGDH